MNTSLFVGLCEDAGLEVDFVGGLSRITDADGAHIAEVSETIDGRYWIDTNMLPRDAIPSIAKSVTKYAFTPIKERE